MKKLIASLFALALSITGAFAQTPPDWTQNYVPTPAEWNAVFAGKQDYLGSAPLLVNGGVMTGELVTAPSTTNTAGFNIPPGVAPTAPVNGDMWSTTLGLFVRIAGTTIGPLAQGSGGSFAATSPLSVTFPSSVVTYACVTCAVTTQPLSQFAATTSAQMRATISDETGTGLAVFQNGALGSPTATTLALNGATLGANTLAVNGPVMVTGAVTVTSLALGGATIGGNALAVTGTTSFGGTVAITSASAQSFSVGLNGTTNPAFNVDSSTASSATGLNIKSAATGGGVAITATDSGSNTSLSINAKGTGTITLGSAVIHSGVTTLTGATTFSAALTYGGVTLANSVTGTGSMVLSSAPSIASLTVTTAFNATGLVTFADMATAAVATTSQYFTGTASTLVPTSVIYSTETTTTFGTTTTFDFNTFLNTAVTLTGNITTQTLSNVKAGQSGVIRFIQDGTGSRTTVWNSIFKFTGGVTPILSTLAGASDDLFYTCISATRCDASLGVNFR